MRKSIKIGLIILVLVALFILIYTAISENFFFCTLNTTVDNAFTESGHGYELYFFMYGNSDSEENSFFKVATLFYEIEQDNDDIAHITFRLSPVDRFKVDSMNLNIYGIQPTSALILENPESGQNIPFFYERSDNISHIAIDFPDLKLGYTEPITIDFWLDLKSLHPTAEDDLTLGASFTVYDKSIFKIVKYVSNFAFQIEIP